MPVLILLRESVEEKYQGTPYCVCFFVNLILSGVNLGAGTSLRDSSDHTGLWLCEPLSWLVVVTGPFRRQADLGCAARLA